MSFNVIYIFILFECASLKYLTLQINLYQISEEIYQILNLNLFDTTNKVR